MIEKLDVLNNTTNVFTTDKDVTNVAVGAGTINKINEIIDVVNAQRIDLNNHTCRLMALENKDNPVADTFAEQCKWRGKLCKFWDSEATEDCTYGLLRNVFDIYHNDCPFQCENGEWYEYCEPVKPDSDVVYKGE